ncbi:two component transcriptional regulator, LytTR family [Filimonas lacunae]|uniref:Two component transcriptional regulator, LytTR family n=1 Tax=Filimonas lacunae TaxID=477680 RepID=A0A173MLY5_9BACT|nr:LytTR family DNA-binding domain-containing protein [Filimonas lacunae]BAV08663.1 two-component system response regulator [Filimonas lacunae]SIS59536.1 two component transcriptional regulator, LytTR family [Filimonas lacunae]
MPLRCIAIDDEPLALEVIRDFAERINEMELVAAFEDAVSASEFIRTTGNIDLILIDIQMPAITGIQLIQSLQHKPLFIFTTAYKEFAFEGFEMNAVDYLLKPIAFERFEKAITKAIDMHRLKQQKPSLPEGSLMVYAEYNMVKINYVDIEYIESVQDYIRIHIKNSKPIMTLLPLKKVLEKLPEQLFQRIHRSYIVAVNEIQAILHKKIKLTSGTELPVGESYASFIRSWKQQGQ